MQLNPSSDGLLVNLISVIRATVHRNLMKLLVLSFLKYVLWCLTSNCCQKRGDQYMANSENASCKTTGSPSLIYRLCSSGFLYFQSLLMSKPPAYRRVSFFPLLLDVLGTKGIIIIIYYYYYHHHHHHHCYYYYIIIIIIITFKVY